MTGHSTGTQTPQDASQAHVAARELPGGPITSAGSGLRSVDVDDASIQAAMQPWIEMECYQLGPGRRLAQMDSLDLGSQQVVRETQAATVQKLGVTPPDLCTVSFCTPAPTAPFSELCVGDADTIFFMPEDTEFDIYVPAGAQTAYVSFSQEEFLNGARALNPMEWERTPQQLLPIPTTQQAAFKSAVNLLFEVAERSVAPGAPLDTALMHDIFLHNILHIAAASRPGELRPSSTEKARAFHICRMARAFVEDSLAVGVVPTVVDICTSVGVSERTLQYAFRTYVDMSPLAYLRMRRLNRVRATLRASDPKITTVTAVAMRFGFLHLGRFALDYKRAFNESPSATLAI